MDTIKTYLETMFSALPQTAESFRLKNELLISMEEKYNELKAAGKSENEAIGTVISEFGNIEELVEVTGTRHEGGGKILPVVELAEAQKFLSEGKTVAFKTAVSVFLIIIGVSLLLFSLAAGEFKNSSDENLIVSYLTAGITSMIVFVAVAVGILTSTWVKFSNYYYLNANNEFILPEHVRQYAENFKSEFAPKKITMIVTGVVLCTLSSIAVIIPALLMDGEYVLLGVSVLLGIIAFGVFPLVIMGVTEVTIASLLRSEWYVNEFCGKPDTASAMKIARIVGTVAAFYWPLICALYLLFSFLWDSWHISWIMWPVAALIFGAFSGAVGAYYGIDESKLKDKY
ncbi:MAG: permease prefix domain 1-containing protein [Oscillospiraceae bacterium]|nr:permease prefix domain 1-containing protein [Oscillospiraceae bacterium]